MKKLNIVDVLVGIIELVEHHTGVRCYDYVEVDTNAPYYYIDLSEHEPTAAKTMWEERQVIYIHAITKGDSSVGIYNAIQALEEAMTNRIPLPKEYALVMQKPQGIINKYREENGNWHAVLGYELDIKYRYMKK